MLFSPSLTILVPFGLPVRYVSTLVNYINLTFIYVFIYVFIFEFDSNFVCRDKNDSFFSYRSQNQHQYLTVVVKSKLSTSHCTSEIFSLFCMYEICPFFGPLRTKLKCSINFTSSFELNELNISCMQKKTVNE